MDYLLGFEGRINRAKLWAFVVISIVWCILIGIVVGLGFDWSAFGHSLREQLQSADHTIDWRALAWPSLEPIGSTLALALILLLLFVLYWANLAVMMKRLHDRDKSGWWLLLFWLVPMVFAYLPLVLVLRVGPSPQLAMAFLAGRLTAMGINLWAFIELFCLRGTAGANRYGSDPLSILRSYID